jgi:hypothetical protein
MAMKPERTEKVDMPDPKQEPYLTMVISAGLFLVGTIIGGNKLVKPRIFTLIENGNRIQMSPLPGTPAFARIDPGGIYYNIPPTELNKSIYDLYRRVTAPDVDPGVDPQDVSFRR